VRDADSPALIIFLHFSAALCAAGLALAAHLAATPPALAAPSTPFTDSQSFVAGSLSPGGRIRPCPGSIPNCVSTSSTSDLYSPALSSPDAPPDAAAALDASAAALLGATRVAAVDPACPPGAVFRAYRIPRPASARGGLTSGGALEDTLEVLLKPVGRDSDGAGSTVLFRSVAGGATYVFPFQTPILDSVQRDRVAALFRAGLGWRPIGCDLLECYDGN